MKKKNMDTIISLKCRVESLECKVKCLMCKHDGDVSFGRYGWVNEGEAPYYKKCDKCGFIIEEYFFEVDMKKAKLAELKKEIKEMGAGE